MIDNRKLNSSLKCKRYKVIATMNYRCVLTLLLLLVLTSNAARILALFPIGSKSHKLAAVPIVEALAEKGHQIALFSPYAPVKETANVVEYQLDIHDFLGEMDWFAMQQESPLTQMSKMMTKGREEMIRNYKVLRDHKELRRRIQERDFDLIFADGYSSEYYPLIDQLGVPLVQHLSTGAMVGLVHQFDGSKEYAYVPNGVTDFEDQMNFFQRMANFLSAEVSRIFVHYSLIRPVDEIVKKDFPHYRGCLEASESVDLILANSHHTSTWLRSLPPNVIPIGSVHTRPANKLEEVN